VEVLTAGEKIEPDPLGKPQTVNVVTLLLNSEGSQKLLLASTQGTIQFVLRNGADETQTPVAPTSLNQLVSASPQTAPQSATKTAKRSAPKPSASEAYALEVIRGNTRSVEKF
jgi:pilus assembly protein CpaB